MQALKEQLIQKINVMPDEAVVEVFDFVNQIENNELDNITGPESTQVRNKEALIKKIQEGLDDVEAGRVYSLEESLKIMRNV